MFHAGDQVGPYILVGQLGHGAFGLVWLGERRGLTTTQFAIKLPLSSSVDVAQIKREAEVWAQAKSHPNVLPLIEADIYNGQVAIISEYAPDGSLADWIDRHGGKAPSIQAAAQMALDILSGLNHLHSRPRPIIHRDLKPANILLQGETPRLADFGLAKVLRGSSDYSGATGSLPYMAPEALRGKISKRTDMWSVGIIFYELLTGHLPFPGSRPAEIIDAIRSRLPVPVDRSIPQPIRKFIARALNKNPGHRFNSASEMRQALSKALEQSDLPNRSTIRSITGKGGLGDAIKALFSRPASLKRSLIIMLAVLGLAGLSGWQYYRSLPGLYMEIGQQQLKEDNNDLAIGYFTYVISRQPYNAEAYFKRGQAYESKGDHDNAIADFSSYINLRKDDSQGYSLRGQVYEAKCDCKQAIVDYNQAISINPQDAKPYFYRGRATVNSGDTDGGIKDLDTAIKLDPEFVDAYKLRGKVYLDGKGDIDRAISDFTEVIHLNPNTLDGYFDRGRAYYMKDQYDLAIVDDTQAIHLMKDNPSSQLYFNRALDYFAKQDYLRATDDLFKTIELDEEDPNAHYNLGKILVLRPDYGEAIKEFNKAIQYWNKKAEVYKKKKESERACSCNPSYEDPDEVSERTIDPEVYFNRGLAYAGVGNYANAIDDLRVALVRGQDTGTINEARKLLQKLTAK